MVTMVTIEFPIPTMREGNLLPRQRYYIATVASGVVCVRILTAHCTSQEMFIRPYYGHTCFIGASLREHHTTMRCMHFFLHTSHHITLFTAANLRTLLVSWMK